MLVVQGMVRSGEVPDQHWPVGGYCECGDASEINRPSISNFFGFCRSLVKGRRWVHRCYVFFQCFFLLFYFVFFCVFFVFFQCFFIFPVFPFSLLGRLVAHSCAILYWF